jgi:integrase
LELNIYGDNMVNSKGKSVVIRPGVRLYKQKRSPYWWMSVRFEGEEIRKSAETEDQADATTLALELAAEVKVKKQHGLSLRTIPLFKDIAGQIVASLESTKYGKANDKQVIRAINRYLVPYLGNKHIDKVDRVQIYNFYQWRQQQTGKEISPTQRNNTTNALKKIFDLACDQGHIRQSDIPSLPKPIVKKPAPRDYFEPAELKKIFNQKHFDEFIGVSRKAITRTYRQIFPYYITFLFFTGVRPGEEAVKLKYGDFKFVKHKQQTRCIAAITKGKTISYSSGRDVYVDDVAVKALRHPAQFSVRHGELTKLEVLAKQYPGDHVFYAYLDGEEPKLPDFTRVMEQYMGYLGMGTKNHTLYSFRHSYITYKLLADVSAYDIAKQCGTSESMIEQFYDHVRPLQKAENLKFKDVKPGQGMESWLLSNG